MRTLIIASLLAVGSVGCDKLISSDVTETRFALPMRSFSFDSSSFGAPSGISNEVPCGAGQAIVDCCAPPVPVPGLDCSVTQLGCEQNENGMSVCTAHVPVSQGQMLNLGQEVPKLAPYTGYVDIKIKRISYAVTTNTLNVNLPDVSLYLAPQGVTSASDPSAEKFGTMPAIAAGDTPAGDVVLEPNATQVLNKFTQDIRTPFSFIAGTTVTVTRSPTGKIDLTVTGELAASL